jgi:UDP-3-O-[3-hydroxymyristoyl] glucosamine N-acyltransferase
MITLQQIIDIVQPTATQIATPSVLILEPIQLDANNERNDVVMWVSSKNIQQLQGVKKGTIICPKVDAITLSDHCNYLFTDNPRRAFSQVLKTFFVLKEDYSVAPSAHIDPSVFLPKNVVIGKNVVIERDCQIGENVKIGHNTVLHAKTIVHNHVTIGCNNTIGGVGFGYEKDDNGEYVVIPHIGNVVLHEYVEIGNNNTIDRAVMGSTILRKNVKVDNLVHIAHGVVIDENSLIIANAMIGGSTQIGKNVWVAPSSTLINKIKIGDDAVIGLGAVVVKSVDSQAVVVGNPAKPLEKKG